MKTIGLSLCLALFFSPILANSESPAEKPTSYSKTDVKVKVSLLPKSGIKMLSALVKTGIGIGLIAAAGFVIVTGTCAIIDREIESWDTTIKLVEKTKQGITRTDEFHFNALPIVTAFWGVIAGTAIAGGAFAINSAVNDLQSLNSETNE